MRTTLLLAALFAAAPAGAKLNVVASTPDLADLAKRVGGDRVRVESLAKGTEDIHAVPQRPSFLPKLNRADAVVSIGLNAEHAFLPALLEVAQNPKVLPGQPGYIDLSTRIEPLEVPKSLSRAEGELHPNGNPHYNIDPRKGAVMADELAEGFSRLDSEHAAEYEKNAAAFKTELAKRLEGWRKLAAPLKGLKIVPHHRDMAYLADFAGMRIVGEVEPKPGIAPTPRHLEELARLMKSEGAKVVVREVHFPPSSADWLTAQTGARTAVVAVMGGAFPDAQDWFGMIDHNLKALVEAAK